MGFIDPPKQVPYKDLLKDPRWQEKRKVIINRDNGICQVCGRKPKSLHVHHMKYWRKPWQAKDEWLICLCEHCHEQEERYLKEDPYLQIWSKETLFPATQLRDLMVELFESIKGKRLDFDNIILQIELIRSKEPPSSILNTIDEFVSSGLGGNIKKNPHFRK